MTYDRQILDVLMEMGEKGISVQMLSKHLYNMNVSLFSMQDIDEIRAYVQQYLLKNSKSANSLIESTGKRGFYRLNTQNNADARQLMLEFKNLEEISQEESLVDQQPDMSLDLFA